MLKNEHGLFYRFGGGPYFGGRGARGSCPICPMVNPALRQLQYLLHAKHIMNGILNSGLYLILCSFRAMSLYSSILFRCPLFAFFTLYSLLVVCVYVLLGK